MYGEKPKISGNVDISTLIFDGVVQDGATLTGTLSDNVKISIADGATVTLNGVNIGRRGTDNSNYIYQWAGLTCEGDATITLADGSTNTVQGFDRENPGILVAKDKTLTITGTGSLTASTFNNNASAAAIGSAYNSESGNIIINGGSITATGGKYSAAIGASYNAPCGNIVISGGTIVAQGGENGAGIGSGYRGSCGNITIGGSTVTATGGKYGAGIGSGDESSCGNILIESGTIDAISGTGGAGIGSGCQSSCGKITITDGVTQVSATTENDDCIGKGRSGSCGQLSIGGAVCAPIYGFPQKTYTYKPVIDISTLTGNLTVYGSVTLSGKLNGNYGVFLSDGATVKLNGVSINAETDGLSNYNRPGITCNGNATIILVDGTTNTVRGGNDPGIQVPKNLTIKGNGSLTAISTGEYPGIGSGVGSGDILIEGGTITAIGGKYSAGIGGGGTNQYYTCGNITISGGTVTATGGEYAAGVGAGGYVPCGDITISGGTVTATGGRYGSGIGGGADFARHEDYCGNITISGGTVNATGGNYASGIGGDMQFGDITIANSVTSVTATKGNGAACSIGYGYTQNGSYGKLTLGTNVQGFITQSPYTFVPPLTLKETAGTYGANGDESYDKLLDGDKSTKWCVTSLGNPTYIEFEANRPFVPVGYVLTTGGDTKDNAGRNPKSWVIKAKADSNDEWTTIASVTDDTRMPAANTTDCGYAIGNNTTAYKYFRFEITALQEGSVFQLAEFAFVTAEDVAAFSKATVSGLQDYYPWTGNSIDIAYNVVNVRGETLTKGTDFTVKLNGTDVTSQSPLTVTNTGDYTLTLTGTGSYSGTQEFLFTVIQIPATPTGLLVDDEIPYPGVGHFYVNMPKEYNDKVYVTLSDASVTTFKVYDDGGKGGDESRTDQLGNYSNGCNGELFIYAPTGYVLQLTGTIRTQGPDYSPIKDYLKVEDTNGELLPATCSPSYSAPLAIGPLYSSGSYMKINFASDSWSNSAGLDLTVKLVDPNALHNIDLVQQTGGIIAKDVETAKVNTPVTLTAKPNSNYLLDGISVVDADGEAVSVSECRWYSGTNEATFTMPSSAVTVTPTFRGDLTADGELSIDMPVAGGKTITIPDGVQSFKVYDDGGATGHYSVGCNGTLTLTAPAGKVLKLTGKVMTEQVSGSTYNDYLIAYDGVDNQANVLLPKTSSTDSNGNPTDIATVVSIGQNMTICFIANQYNTGYDGLDLTVTVVDPDTYYAISIAEPIDGGTVAKSSETARAGQQVTLTAMPTPNSSYRLNFLTVDDGNNAVPVTGGTWYTSNEATFTMPTAAVTVRASFTDNPANLFINMPASGHVDATIPSGVQSFRIFDNGGYAGNYGKNCDGTLTLTVPEGYVMRLTGSLNTEEWSGYGDVKDYLSVFDGANTQATALLTEKYSTWNNNSIGILTSSGRSMTLLFRSDNNYEKQGLDLTVRVYDPNTLYDIALMQQTGGTIESAEKAKAGTNVTLTATPGSNYLLDGISVVDGDGEAVSVSDCRWYSGTNEATFLMPVSAVTVTPTFISTDGLSVNMPVTDQIVVTIPSGVETLNIYDDGGATNSYSSNCNGTLTLTAPEGFVLQLTGSVVAESSGCDYLTVYDGADKTATELYTSEEDDPVGTITTSGRSMTLNFRSDSGVNFAGLNLTLRVLPAPANTIDVTAKQATVNGETDYWTTFYCGKAGYDITTTGANAYIATYEYDSSTQTESVTLHKQGTTIPKATAVVIVGNSAAISLTKNANANKPIDVNSTPYANHLHGIDVSTPTIEVMTGTFSGCTPFVLSKKNDVFGFFEYTGVNLPAGKAFLAINNTSGALSRGMNIIFDKEETGIEELEATNGGSTDSISGWYTLDGRRLSKKPTSSGMYINNGRKIVVK